MEPVTIAVLAGAAFFGLKALANKQQASIDDNSGDTNGFVAPPAQFVNDATVLSLAYGAGFRNDDLSTAVAIALAESGGNVNAYNPEIAAGAPVGQGSFGLWQIYVKAHPGFGDLFDPVTNANAAYRVYLDAGSSFRPWSTFKNQAYLSYLDRANTVIAANDPSILDGAVSA